MPRPWPSALLLVPAVLALAVYATGLDNGFVWIDHSEVLGRTKIIESWGELGTTFVQARNGAGYHRPVYDVLFTVDHLVWGDDPFGFHLSSALLHALNALLFTLLLARVARLSVAWAVFGGALFALHPLHAAVAGLVHAKADLFGMLCMLVAVHAGAAVVRGRRRLAWGALGVAACVLGTLTKELVFLLPPAVVLWGFAHRREQRGLFGYGLALCAAVLPVGILHLFATAGLDRPESPLGLGERLATFQSVYLEGLWLMVWPADTRLADTVTRFAALPAWQRIATMLGFAAALTAMVVAARRWPRLAPWIVTYHVALLPVAQLVPILHFRADRYFYVSGLAFAGAVATAGAIASRRAPIVERIRLPAVRAVAVLAATMLFIAAGARVVFRVGQFTDDRTLFIAELARTPDYLEGATHFGRACERLGDWQTAERCYRMCLAPHPARISYVDRDAVAVNLTNNLLRQGDDAGAWEVAQRELDRTRSPAHRAELRFNGGVAAYHLARFEDAADWLEAYTVATPSPDPEAWFLLGASAARAGQRDRARGALERYLAGSSPDPVRAREARRVLEGL